jgi:Heterokaryon incompatibility protein (HET)
MILRQHLNRAKVLQSPFKWSLKALLGLRNRSVSSKTSLPYQQLGKDAIRLLTIESHNGLIAVCKLQTYLRASAPEYDAVTYTWGKDRSTTPIACNGAHIHIRTALFRALPYLDGTRPGPKRPLWIDALCLDQENDDEKAIHVPLMGKIYQQAARTLIWLGEAADGSGLAIYSIPSLTQKMAILRKSQVNHVEVLMDLGNHDLPSKDHPVWKALQKFQQRPWFYRLWTLQEIVLSKDPVIICGNRSISWNALRALHREATLAKLTMVALPAISSENPRGDFLTLVKQIDEMRLFRKGNWGMRLFVALEFSRHRKYTETLDRFWAILGLLQDRHLKILQDANLIDYSPAARLNYHETYLGIMKAYISHHPLGAIQLLEAGLSQTKNPKLPSWCPDWHLKQSSVSVSYLNDQYTKTQGTVGALNAPINPPRPEICLDGDCSLNVLGIVLDEVSQVSSGVCKFRGLDLKSATSGAYAPSALASIPLETLGIGDSESSVSISALAYKIPRRSAVAPVERNPFSTEGPSTYELWDDHEWMGILRELMFPGQFLDFQNAWVLVYCGGRKLFSTSTGKKGAGPADMQAGDIICAFYGGSTLVVLRPLKCNDTETEDNGLQNSQETFRVIGDAYMPDLMPIDVFQDIEHGSKRHFRLI